MYQRAKSLHQAISTIQPYLLCLMIATNLSKFSSTVLSSQRKEPCLIIHILILNFSFRQVQWNLLYFSPGAPYGTASDWVGHCCTGSWHSFASGTPYWASPPVRSSSRWWGGYWHRQGEVVHRSGWPCSPCSSRQDRSQSPRASRYRVIRLQRRRKIMKTDIGARRVEPTAGLLSFSHEFESRPQPDVLVVIIFGVWDMEYFVTSHNEYLWRHICD